LSNQLDVSFALSEANSQVEGALDWVTGDRVLPLTNKAKRSESVPHVKLASPIHFTVLVISNDFASVRQTGGVAQALISHC